MPTTESAPSRAPAAPPAPTAAAVRLAFGTIYIVWGSTYLGIRVAVSTIPPFLMAGCRFLVAGTLLFIYLKLRGAPWPTARQWRINAGIGVLLLLGGNGIVGWAEQFLPSGITALIIGVQPLFFVLTEWCWPGGSRPGLVTSCALLLGFFGVAWLTAPWQHGLTDSLDQRAVAAVLVSAALWAIGSIASRHARHGAEPLLASSLQMLSGSAALLFVAGLRGEWSTVNVLAISPASWFAFAYLIVIGSLVGFSTFVWLMKNSTPARVSTYAYVNPIVAVLLGWLLLGEPVSQRTVVASAIIVVAVIIVTTQKNRVKP